LVAVFWIWLDADFFALADLEMDPECIRDHDFDPDLK
jgi:hypothetical protein